MFVLLFAFVFGGVIAVPGGGDYHEYLIGGILVQTLAFGMMGPGVSMATDLGEGILDRFRSLPMLRPAFLLGHLTAEFARLGAGGGDHGRHRPDRRLVDRLQRRSKRIGGFALTALLAVTMLWLGTLIGVIARSPDVVQGIAFLVDLPADLHRQPRSCRSAGCPTASVSSPNTTRSAPGRPAVRTLFGNPTAIPADAAWPLQHPVLSSVLWCLAILAVVVPLTLRAYRRRTTG